MPRAVDRRRSRARRPSPAPSAPAGRRRRRSRGTGRHRRRGSGRGPRAVAHRDAVDRHAAAGERLELRRLDPARQAPAGEDVDDLRLALAQVALDRPGRPGMPGGRSKSGTGWPISCELDRRVPPARRGRRRRRRGRATNSAERHPEDQPALHAGASSAWPRRSRRRRPTSASRPPKATSAPPSQIRVTNGFHHRRSCQRPCSSSSPIAT